MKEHEGKKHLMVDGCMINKVLSKVKEVTGIEKFDNNEILIDTDDKLPDDITLKKCCGINDMCCKRWW